MIRALLFARAAASMRATATQGVKRAARTVMLMVAGGLLVLIGVIFLAVAATLALVPYLGAAGATAAMGGAFMLVALVLVAMAAKKPARPADPVAAFRTDMSRQLADVEKTARSVAGRNPFGFALGAIVIGILLGRRL